MSDLPDDQLPDDPDAATLPVMGRGKYHPDYLWIVRGLDATGQSQAALAAHLKWDAPTMSRQLKGKRELKARESTLIHKFFAAYGYSSRTADSGANSKLTIESDTTDRPAPAPVVEEGKLDIALMLLDELKQAVADLRGRVQDLERSGRSEATDNFKGARRK